MSNLNATALFPTFLFSRDHPDAAALNRRLAREGYRLRELDPEGVKISNQGGWQSANDLHTRAEFASFTAFVDETVREVKEFLSIAADVDLRVSNCWFNINPTGCFNTRHVHGNSYFSGAYYVRASEDSGSIRFFDPTSVRHCYFAPVEELNPRNCFSHAFKPVEGRLLIFPGYVPHEVTPNLGEHDRMSISFNVVGN